MNHYVLRIALSVVLTSTAALAAGRQANPGGGQSASPNTPSTPQNAPANTPGNRQQPSTAQPGNTSTTDRTNSNATRPGTNSAAITEAIEMNTADAALGREAAKKAQNARVKSFAEMMVKDHNEAVSKLRSIAGASAEVKPNAEHQKVADRLSKLSGSQFDREYMNEMVAGHEKAVRFFEEHSKDASTTATASDKSLASVSKELLQVVRMHLKEAQQIQQELQGNNSKSGANSSTSDSTRTPSTTR